MPFEDVEAFVLRGASLAATYEPASGRLVLEEGGRERELRAQAEETAVGVLATAFVAAVPDLSTTTLTLVLPRVGFGEDDAEVPVTALALRTTHRTSIAGPGLVTGARQEHEAEPLEGVARRRR